MEWVETTGRTIADALDAALDELGVDEEEVEYEVLVEPRGGLRGRFGGGEARIRARVKPRSREKPGERRRHARRARAGGQADGDGAQSGREEGARAAAGAPVAQGVAGGDTRGPRGDGPRSAGGNGGDTVSTTQVPATVQAAAAEDFVEGLVAAFGVPATVTTTIEDDVVLVDVEGTDLGLLVGPRGATLRAIEELTRAVVLRRTGGHGVRINVDIGGYQAKRREALAEFARRLAQKVIETGREQALEPMSAADRKVVHDTIAALDGVTTISEGEEPRRRVVVRRA